jgi:methanogenic corrinoid protein MtbC1
MKEIIALLNQAGLRERVKVIIGGGVTTEQVRDYVGADAQTMDAAEGVEICKKFVNEFQK